MSPFGRKRLHPENSQLINRPRQKRPQREAHGAAYEHYLSRCKKHGVEPLSLERWTEIHQAS